MIKLVVSDLDGTLVPEGSGALPQELVDTLDRLQAAGIPFAVSSGRQHASLRQVFRPLAVEPYILSLNGGCICKGDECLYLDPMPQQEALEIARQASQLPYCDVILETREECWIYRSRNGVAGELDVRQYHYTQIQELEALRGQVVKVACYLTDGLQEFLREYQQRWGEVCNVARSGERWVDFNISDKGKGLKALCRLLNVDPAETVAFGDNLNDQPMLAAAGTSWVAPGGNPELRKRFPTCQDPRWEIEKIFQKNQKSTCIPKEPVLS